MSIVAAPLAAVALGDADDAVGTPLTARSELDDAARYAHPFKAAAASVANAATSASQPTLSQPHLQAQQRQRLSKHMEAQLAMHADVQRFVTATFACASICHCAHFPSHLAFAFVCFSLTSDLQIQYAAYMQQLQQSAEAAMMHAAPSIGGSSDQGGGRSANSVAALPPPPPPSSSSQQQQQQLVSPAHAVVSARRDSIGGGVGGGGAVAGSESKKSRPSPAPSQLSAVSANAIGRKSNRHLIKNALQCASLDIC